MDGFRTGKVRMGQIVSEPSRFKQDSNQILEIFSVLEGGYFWEVDIWKLC